MPELPEVETVRAGLAALLGRDASIARVAVHRRDLRRPIPAGLERAVAGQAIRALHRRGKFLLWRLERHSLVTHLGMTGSWRLDDGAARPHDHCAFTLADGRRLIYHDPRRFGLIEHVVRGTEDEHPWLRRLGPEPLDPAWFTPAHLARICAGRRGAIKAVIMTSSVVVGVGNIYAAEALFRAGIRPQTPAGRIGRRRLDRLHAAIPAVLAEAIAAGGSTIRDFRQAGGSAGYFQTRFAVYGRGGAPCRRCGAPLAETVLAGRTTVWCRRCQR